MLTFLYLTFWGFCNPVYLSLIKTENNPLPTSITNQLFSCTIKLLYNFSPTLFSDLHACNMAHTQVCAHTADI